MKKTKQQPSNSKAQDFQIDHHSVDTFLNLLSIEKTPPGFIRELHEKFNLLFIQVDTDAEITEMDCQQIFNKGKKVNVTGFKSKTEWTKVILESGSQIIGYFIKMLRNLRESDEYTYTEKHEFLSTALLELSEMRNSVFLRNRFFFAANTTFFVKKDDKREAPLMYHMLNFTGLAHNELKEIFQIRFELYDELLIQTKFMLSVLENDRYKYSTFQLDPKHGKYIVMELVMALTAKNTYLKLDVPGRQQLTRSLFDLFGLDYKDTSGLEQDIYARKNKGKYLEKLANLI